MEPNDDDLQERVDREPRWATATAVEGSGDRGAERGAEEAGQRNALSARETVDALLSAQQVGSAVSTEFVVSLGSQVKLEERVQRIRMLEQNSAASGLSVEDGRRLRRRWQRQLRPRDADSYRIHLFTLSSLAPENDAGAEEVSVEHVAALVRNMALPPAQVLEDIRASKFWIDVYATSEFDFIAEYEQLFLGRQLSVANFNLLPVLERALQAMDSAVPLPVAEVMAEHTLQAASQFNTAVVSLLRKNFGAWIGSQQESSRSDVRRPAWAPPSFYRVMQNLAVQAVRVRNLRCPVVSLFLGVHKWDESYHGLGFALRTRRRIVLAFSDKEDGNDGDDEDDDSPAAAAARFRKQHGGTSVDELHKHWEVVCSVVRVYRLDGKEADAVATAAAEAAEKEEQEQQQGKGDKTARVSTLDHAMAVPAVSEDEEEDDMRCFMTIESVKRVSAAAFRTRQTGMLSRLLGGRSSDRAAANTQVRRRGGPGSTTGYTNATALQFESDGEDDDDDDYDDDDDVDDDEYEEEEEEEEVKAEEEKEDKDDPDGIAGDEQKEGEEGNTKEDSRSTSRSDGDQRPCRRGRRKGEDGDGGGTDFEDAGAGTDVTDIDDTDNEQRRRGDRRRAHDEENSDVDDEGEEDGDSDRSGEDSSQEGGRRSEAARLAAREKRAQRALLQRNAAVSAIVEVWGWGDNHQSCLGVGDIHARPAPVMLQPYHFLPSERVASISTSGVHTLFATTMGAVYSCGDGTDGALGHGDLKSCTTPVLVQWFTQRQPMVVITQVSAGHGLLGGHSTAVDAEGRLYSWGLSYATGHGSTAVPYTEPQEVELDWENKGKEFVTHVATGGAFTVAVCLSGRIYSWGAWARGRLGLGKPVAETTRTGGRQQKKVPRYQLLPKRISTLIGHTPVHVSCGDAHALVVTDVGEVWAWGSNSHGQVGTGVSSQGFLADQFYPTRIAPFMRHDAYSHTLAVVRQAEHLVAPAADAGAGAGPVPPSQVRVTQVRCGTHHSMVVDVDGHVWSWGANGGICLGHGDMDSIGAADRAVLTTPPPVSAAFKSRFDGTMIRYEDLRRAKQWSTPRKIQALLGDRIAHISGGHVHSAAVNSDGEVYIWGGGPAALRFRAKGAGPVDESERQEVQDMMHRTEWDQEQQAWLESQLEPVPVPLQPSDHWYGRVCTKSVSSVTCGGMHMFITSQYDHIARRLTRPLYERTLKPVETQQFVDCVLVAGGRNLYAHRAILSARSPYLRDLIIDEEIDEYQNLVEVLLPDMRYEVARALVEFCYTGNLSGHVLVQTSALASDLRVAAIRFRLPRLEWLCLSVLTDGDDDEEDEEGGDRREEGSENEAHLIEADSADDGDEDEVEEEDVTEDEDINERDATGIDSAGNVAERSKDTSAAAAADGVNASERQQQRKRRQREREQRRQLRARRKEAKKKERQRLRHPRTPVVLHKCPETSLSKDMTTLAGAREYADIKFVASGHVLYAHRFVLETRSEYFRAMFRFSAANKAFEIDEDTGSISSSSSTRSSVEVVVPDNFVSFLRLLLFMYSGMLPNATQETLLTDLVSADRYRLEDLKRHCESALDVSKSNVLLALGAAELVYIPRLKEESMMFLARHLDTVTRLPEYPKFAQEHPHVLQALSEKVSVTVPAPVPRMLVDSARTSRREQELSSSNDDDIPWVALAIAAVCCALYYQAVRVVALGPVVPVVNVASVGIIIYLAYRYLGATK